MAAEAMLRTRIGNSIAEDLLRLTLCGFPASTSLTDLANENFLANQQRCMIAGLRASVHRLMHGRISGDREL